MIYAGVDTHKDFHIMALVDGVGRVLSTHRVSADADGYAQASRILGALKGVALIGIEGAGSYGAGLARHLAREGYALAEIARPKRPRRRPGEHKSDEADAIRAARDAARDEGLPRAPKPKTGWVEAVRTMLVAHASAKRARTAHMNAMCGLVISSPEEVRSELAGLKGARLAHACAKDHDATDAVASAAWVSLASLAALWLAADAEVRALAAAMEGLLEESAPRLMEAFGIGPVSAAALAQAAGDDVGRIANEGSFAAMCGASPVEATSGKMQGRHRLNRGGDRRANAALHTIAIVRMRYDKRTQDYVARKLSEGKTKREAIRCLKRYIAREVYRLLKASANDQLTMP